MDKVCNEMYELWGSLEYLIRSEAIYCAEPRSGEFNETMGNIGE